MNESSVYYCPIQKFLAFKAKDSLVYTGEDSVLQIENFITKNQGEYIISAFSYDLKNHFESLNSKNNDLSEFPDVILWVPVVVIQFEGDNYQVLKGELTDNDRTFVASFLVPNTNTSLQSIRFKSRISKEAYIEKVNLVKAEIQQGNCYELNFCQEFYAENVGSFDSITLFNRLFEITKAPFAVYFSFDNWEVFCASPERYLKREGNQLLSEPIKGTIKRGETVSSDKALIHQLQNDHKERAENVMIVDLVRNDLSKIATKGSVRVDELCGIHTFETVHHMISTVSCTILPETSFITCLKASFPMGSMTGAPKVNVMKLIERLESFKRGIYSGSLGLIKPNGDFDLNVVIRSLVYNREKASFSCSVGSAITINSDAEKEFDECSVKIKKIIGVFEDN
jgi:para-aminobenzoate synthetase component 1